MLDRTRKNLEGRDGAGDLLLGKPELQGLVDVARILPDVCEDLVKLDARDTLTLEGILKLNDLGKKLDELHTGKSRLATNVLQGRNDRSNRARAKVRSHGNLANENLVLLEGGERVVELLPENPIEAHDRPDGILRIHFARICECDRRQEEVLHTP